MADNGQEYIGALQNFSKAVEILAESIREQVEASKNTDAINETLDNAKEQTKHLIDIAKELSVVQETVQDTKNDTKKILNIVSGIKREKQNGIWDRLGTAKDKTKTVAEGVQNVALMAGAILAIGTAFKIVGDVDFDSVIALSVALPLVAIAFNKVGETTSNPKQALNISLSMIMMSAGIAASGAIISFMPSLSFGQMISVIAVSAAVGIAMYGLAVAADEIGNKKIKALYSIIPVMPFTAAAITASGYALANMPIIGIQQFLSALGVGVAMGASMIPLAIAARAIGNDTQKLFMLSFAMPVIAGAILASAYILQDIPDIDFMGIVETTGGITAALVIMGAGMWALDKMGVTPKTAIMGTIMMPIIATGLMLSSWILSAGNYEGGPSVEWATGFGLSMLASMPPILLFGSLAATGFGILVIAAGILSMLAVAGGLVAASHILAGGNYTGGPTVEWAKGVGLALTAFTSAIGMLSPGLFEMLFGETLDHKIESIVKIGGALRDVAAVIKGGSYTGGPSKEWSEGVGIALMTFANALNAIKPNVFESLLGDTVDQNIASIIKLGEALPRIGLAVGKDTSMYTGGPDKRWAEGVGGSLAAFAGALEQVKPGFFDRLFGDTLDTQIAGMIQIARALPKIGLAIGSDTSMYQGGPSKEWADGVGKTVLAFAEGIALLADEIDVEDLYEWLPAMRHMAPLIAYFGNKLKGVQFGEAPSKSWSDGVLHFIENMTEYNGGGDVVTTAKNIRILSNAYFRLARSISALGYSLKKINKVPDLTKIYGGLVTLSLIDKKNLGSVLYMIDAKRNEFSKLISMINAKSEEKINGNFKYLSGGVKETDNNSKNLTSNAKPTVVTSVKTKTPEPVKQDNTDNLLTQLISLQQQMNSVLNEIADNTSQNLKTGGVTH